MKPITLVLFAIAAGFAVAMHYFDRRMQHHRAPGAPETAFRWVPLRWRDPSLYTPEGEEYRRRAIWSWRLMLLFFVGAAIAASARV